MSNEVMYTLEEEEEEDYQEMQKQLRCMNGIFQLFDWRYPFRQRRHGNRNKKLPQGQSVTTNKLINNAPDKLKDEAQNKVMKEKHKASAESSKYSSTSSSSSSSSSSSLDFSKRVQTELLKEHDLHVPPADIRDVVKCSMTRKPRVVSVKTVAKTEPKGPTMTHVDSPRPLQQYPKPVASERRDQNLVKFKETCIPSFTGVKHVKEASRFSYDDRISSYKLKSTASLNNQPRLSLDSKQSFVKHNANVVDQSQTHEPGSNKRPPSSLVARLMGLDVLNREAISVSSGVCNGLTRTQLVTAPLKQEVKQTVKMKFKQRADRDCNGVEFKTSGRPKMKFEKANVTSHSILITNVQKVKKVNAGRGSVRNLTLKKQVTSHTRLQRSKIKKQSNRRLTGSNSKPRDHSKSDTCHTRNLSEDASFSSRNELKVSRKDRTRVNKNKFAERLMGYKPMADEPSPVSVLDAIDTEDAPSPIKKKSYAFKDDEYLCFAEGKQFVNQTESLNCIIDEATINTDESKHTDRTYIKEILLASCLLKNLNFATTIVHLHPTGSLINPELFNIMEKTKESTSKSDKIKRNLIFDTVNRILVQMLSSKRKGRILDEEKVLEELCLEVNNLYTDKFGDQCDCDDIINIITKDLNRKAGDWDRNCNEVPDLVCDIELLIFDDLIIDIMNDAP